MSAVDIYCLSSRAEGFPNVVAEAMSMQVPCVVTNVGDAALIVKDTGKVVAPADSVALADALIGMIDLPHEQRIFLGKRARKVIEDSYSIETVAQQYRNLYSSLIFN
jgi:glycosyltransferase involved in cell wall biosynthesis